jgi:hypothetical protein
VAVWQFKISLLPQQWLDAGGAVDALFGEESYDMSTAWEQADLESIKRRIASILPPGKSYSESQLHWGSYETDDIQLFSENSRVQDLSVRFDLRRPNRRLFDLIVAAAEELHLALVDVARKQVVPRDLQALSRAAAMSGAADFVKDPISFITSGEGERGQAT